MSDLERTLDADRALETQLRSGCDRLDDGDAIYALARRVEGARGDDHLLGDPEAFFEMLRVTAGTLRTLVNDRHGLMAVLEWEDGDALGIGVDIPSAAEVSALVDALGRPGADVDRDVAYRVAVSFQELRKMYVLALSKVGGDRRRWLELDVAASLTRVRTSQLRDLAGDGYAITEADLAWAMEGAEALRSDDPALLIPPCARAEKVEG